MIETLLQRRDASIRWQDLSVLLQWSCYLWKKCWWRMISILIHPNASETECNFFLFCFFLQWRTNLNNSIFLKTSTFYGLLRLMSIRFWSNERGYHIIIYHLSFNFVQSFVSKDSFPEGSQYVFLHNQVKSFAFLAFGLMSLFLFAVPCNDDFPQFILLMWLSRILRLRNLFHVACLFDVGGRNVLVHLQPRKKKRQSV